ncbi:tyrosine-type recombinase/integrase [Leisingera sp. ANG59]|uniref:tyrosine-type recombinase/integrase n=1 Tax=Leisingera sp. ANG59 TaxID=2675221 RepID=UPI0015717D83|nr:tyrosine-type recombinase/integrase [Leisingera sp. ANG59]NSY39778.1 tyrosine-type recombinase/integrase [Leisingera sp. ANG59]
MLERFFVKPHTIDRITECWLGPQIEQYVTALADRAYAPRSIHRRVPLLVKFATFTAAKNVKQLEQAENFIEPFIADRLSGRNSDRSVGAHRRDRNFVAGVMRHFFSLVLWEADSDRTRPPLPDPFAVQVPGFFDYLRDERGLRQGSIKHYRHYLRVFERHLGEIGCDPGALTLPVVTAFITIQAQHFGRTSMISLASNLRVFLRYLHRERILQRDISKLVEIPQNYRLADIPRSISWASVQNMLDQVDRRTVFGRRDYAMLLLMAVYGLRAREVALLTLDDIDWKRDRLHVRGRKAEHSTTYPLAPIVGEAIVDYLRNGRPDVQSRQLFWRHLAPQLPLTHSAVSATASKYLHRAGIPVSRPGSHTLRHACVQRLVDRGFPLKTIGDYVGHRAASSTMIYAKVQVGDLREVAQGDGEDLQ